MHPVSLAYLAGTIDMLCKDLLEAWSEPSTYTFSVDGSSLTMNENSGYGISGTGILYTLTAGLFGIGCLVDFIKILCGKFTDKNGNLIQREKK